MTEALPRPAPLEKSVLSAQVKDRILQWILEGELEPGSRIVETRVARQLGTSQAPVREALRDLATLGFVEMEPYRGARVRKPTKAELTEAVQVRAELEGLAGRLAATRISADCLAELEELYERMLEMAEEGDAHTQAYLNAEFHDKIVRASGNGTLVRLWSMLEPYSRTYVTASLPGIDLRWLAERHVGILEALRARDPDTAGEAMRAHAVQAAELIEQLDDNFQIPPLRKPGGVQP